MREHTPEPIIEKLRMAGLKRSGRGRRCCLPYRAMSWCTQFPCSLPVRMSGARRASSVPRGELPSTQAWMGCALARTASLVGGGSPCQSIQKRSGYSRFYQAAIDQFFCTLRPRRRPRSGRRRRCHRGRSSLPGSWLKPAGGSPLPSPGALERAAGCLDGAGRCSGAAVRDAGSRAVRGGLPGNTVTLKF